MGSGMKAESHPDADWVPYMVQDQVLSGVGSCQGLRLLGHPDSHWPTDLGRSP